MGQCAAPRVDACEEEEDLVEVGEELQEEEEAQEEAEPQEEDDDDLVEVLEDGDAEQDTFEIGEAVEGYWPDDDTWLPATIVTQDSAGFLISWDEDGSQSQVNFDYVRKLSQDEPLAK